MPVSYDILRSPRINYIDTKIIYPFLFVIINKCLENSSPFSHYNPFIMPLSRLEYHKKIPIFSSICTNIISLQELLKFIFLLSHKFATYYTICIKISMQIGG